MKAASIRKNNIWAPVRTDPLGISLLSSCFIHVAVILLASVIIHKSNLRQQDLLTINLIDAADRQEATPIPKKEILPEVSKVPPSVPKPEKTIESKPLTKSETQFKQPPLPASLAREEPAKPVETKPTLTQRPEIISNVASMARPEGGGSEAGAGNTFGKGDVGLVPGSGNSGNGGTAALGLGRGSGAPGLPAQTAILRTNREAKPVQTVRANYPPLALRMGMEGDVTIRIEVDTEGKVTKAEIMKGAGAGFDEEALRAVKQSRFEAAQKDGQNVPAEFTYVYRFRMAK